MKTFLAVLGLIAFVLAIPFLFPTTPTGDPIRAIDGLPWQIEAMPDGTTRVFGLTLGISTLHDARSRFGNDGEVAIVAAPGESGTLEAYYADVTAGAVTGKMVVTGDVDPTAIELMKQRARKQEYMKSSTKKALLSAQDLPLADAAPIRALSFIPSINLDEAMVLQRFGSPAERIRTSEHTEHFLYPERGLDVILDSEGKELLQYVAPRQFDRLRAPLVRQTVQQSP
jgi:hypothetical protein